MCGPYAADWLERRAAKVRPQTLHRYRQLARAYLVPALGDPPLDRVRRADVEKVLDAMRARGLSARTRQQGRAVLSAMSADALRCELVTRNPVEGTDRRRSRART